MQALCRWFLGFVVAGFFLSAVSAQEIGQGQTKFNLDLPFDALGETGEDEEDPPEVVQFYGQNLEGDGFYYVIDRSISMQNSGELQRAKQEITRNVMEMFSKI